MDPTRTRPTPFSSLYLLFFCSLFSPHSATWLWLHWIHIHRHHPTASGLTSIEVEAEWVTTSEVRGYNLLPPPLVALFSWVRQADTQKVERHPSRGYQHGQGRAMTSHEQHAVAKIHTVVPLILSSYEVGPHSGAVLLLAWTRG